MNGSKREVTSALSNILRNAVEAIDKARGKITISVNLVSDFAKISIADNGKGIRQSDIEKVFDKGVTIGKSKGTGLGLYQAKSAVESMDGKISISSIHGTGTEVILMLPIIRRDCLADDKIILTKNTQLVFLDDDSLVLDTWRLRLEQINISELPGPLYFSTSAELRAWLPKDIGNCLFFIDYELNEEKTGLELIEEFGLQKFSYLHTGRASELWLQEMAKAANVRALDKCDAEPKFIFMSSIAAELVLIDDSYVNRLLWDVKAKELNKNIALYADYATFAKDAARFEKVTPIYIDYLFEGESQNGITFAKNLADMGFAEIYLATEYDQDRLHIPSYIKKVVGKDFPLLA